MYRALPGPRLSWFILVPALALSLVGSALIVHRDAVALRKQQATLAEGLARQIARAGHLALVADDRRQLIELATGTLETDPVIGRVRIQRRGPQGFTTVAQSRVADGEAENPMVRLGARIAMSLGGGGLPRTVTAQIPPVGEGSALDPFGTPRADIGRAVIEVSEAGYRRQLAQVAAQGALVGLFLFMALTMTGYGIGFLAARPIRNLSRRLRDLSDGETQATEAAGDLHDIEGSIEAIGERLSQSETRAKRATAALRDRERQLERARQHAEDAARMRADLVAGMSHELRAPLTAVLGHADLLSRTRLDATQREYVDTLRKSARNLLSLIDDVVEWSGLESGRTSLNEVGFDLSETVEDTLNLLAPLAFEKDLELVHLIYQDVPVRLHGDPLRFQQILTNLVSNAIKFTQRGGVTVRLMREEEDEERVTLRVSVADTGPGISEAAQANLFQLYQRGETDRAHVPGSGLGLAISKRLLTMMGGDIEVESKPGQGSDFQFRLPMRKAPHRAQSTVPWEGLRGKRVWLQDDFHTARVALAHKMEPWRIEIVEMETRTDLMACLKETDLPRPDAVVVGLRGEQAQTAELAGVLGELRDTGLPALCLVTSIDRDLHTVLERAGATRSLPKSLNRLRLYRELCRLTGVEIDTEGDAPQPLTDTSVLVADDSNATAAYLTTVVAELGGSSAIASDGERAAQSWRKGRFPLILIDDRMPGVDGVEAIRRIRGAARAGEQPVVIGMTASRETSAANRMKRAGADFCLTKPFDADELRRSLAPYLDRLRARPGDPRDRRASQTRLVSDPELARLLAEELPRQLDAVRDSVQANDRDAAAKEIHALHGTAAFYGLQEIRTIAGRMEDDLQAGRLAGDDDLGALEKAVNGALAALA